MSDPVYPASSPEISEKRRALAPETELAFQHSVAGSSRTAHCRRRSSSSSPSPWRT